MGFIIEQECPQCGAPIELSETDRILSCPYCDVQSYLFFPGYFRYILPHKSPDKEIIYVPYLRFRGSVFYCGETTIGHRIIDITQTGVGTFLKLCGGFHWGSSQSPHKISGSKKNKKKFKSGHGNLFIFFSPCFGSLFYRHRSIVHA